MACSASRKMSGVCSGRQDPTKLRELSGLDHLEQVPVQIYKSARHRHANKGFPVRTVFLP